VAIMYKGEIVEENDAQTIFTEAKHPYTQALIACRPARHKKGEKLPTVSDFLNPSNHEVDVQTSTSEHVFKQSEKVILQAKDLVVRFTTKTNLLGKPKSFFTAVDHVNLDIYKGETLGLVGESGCGKTTLGRTLLKLIPPSSGSIIYNGDDITHLEKEHARKLRKEVQLIFQDPFSSLNPRLTIGDAIAEPMKVTGSTHSSRERKKKVKELLERVSLSDSMMGRYPHEFSGGQRQRIVIARALAMDPAFLVCDESVSALDVSVQAQVLNLLNELKKDLGLTMLFISHDLSVVRYMCDRIMVMNKGKIIESGLSEEVYKHPQTTYTRQLIEAIPNL
ncbi:MAG TPA: ATP-binding cassette domain-containing protein, partial [Flavisolibacter sp.]|nr:ATP-binding cassette domain-containing protein [Flavisolibacter sp.]